MATSPAYERVKNEVFRFRRTISELRRLAIIGCGSWGTALLHAYSHRASTSLTLWVHERDLALRMEQTRVNDIFLPGIPLPPNVRAGHALEVALEGAHVVLSVMPSHAVRDVYTRMLPWLRPSMRIVSATKGLESGTLLRISQVIRSIAGPEYRIAILSGPTFAREAAAGNPTALCHCFGRPGSRPRSAGGLLRTDIPRLRKL